MPLKRGLAPAELEIEPAQLYSTVETLARIPSSHGGTITFDTLHRWRKAGTIEGRRIGRHWFYTGEAILKVLGKDKMELPSGFQSSAQRKREHEADLRKLRAMGILK